MKELKRYVRVKRTFEVDGVQIIDTKGKHIVKKNLGDGFAKYYLYDENGGKTWIYSYILKTADTLLELAQVGDMVEYERKTGKRDIFILKDKLTYEGGVLTEYHCENIRSTYEYDNDFNNHMFLWVRQDEETYKRYEVQS